MPSISLLSQTLKEWTNKRIIWRQEKKSIFLNLFHINHEHLKKKMQLDSHGSEQIFYPNRNFTSSKEYVVNGRSPLEWIMDRYQVKVDKASGIENNPNDWCDEHNNPRYILDLILSCITVSMKTLDIVENLPAVEFS